MPGAPRIDAVTSVAFALRGRPGGYGLLLGSGVSRSAGVPTGWQIVERLIGEVAAAEGVAIGDDPLQWFRQRFGAEPRYSTLIEALGLTFTERQALIARYLTDEDGRARRPATAIMRSHVLLLAVGCG